MKLALTTTTRGLETLDGLARAIAKAHECCEQSKKVEQTAAKWVIDSTFQCGQFLRLAKARKSDLPHGEFQKWVRRTQKFGLRMAQNYMFAHKWMSVKSNQKRLIEANPQSQRQLFILVGILPDGNDTKSRAATKGDDWKPKANRAMMRFLNIVAANRDYEQIEELQKLLEPTKRLIVDVYTDTRV